MDRGYFYGKKPRIEYNGAIHHAIQRGTIENISLMEIDKIDYRKGQNAGEEGFGLIAVQKVQVEARKRLDEILADTGVDMDEYHQIKAGSRRSNLTPYKIEYSKMPYRYNFTLKEIGHNIKLTDAVVFELINLERY
jgi:putative transposase